jgi:tetratricopeptide (TPR) repeat protein
VPPTEVPAYGNNPRRRSRRAPAAAAPQDFASLEKKATAARQAERWEEAIGLYQKLVKLKPDYVEGYWYQGTSYYSLDDYANCRTAFRSVIRRAPKNGAAHAFLGLCEFGLKEYDRALQHLLNSRNLGLGDVPDLGKVARYHAAVLMARTEQYVEQALETLGEFAGEGRTTRASSRRWALPRCGCRCCRSSCRPTAARWS